MRAHIHPDLQTAILTQFMDPGFLRELETELRNLLGETFDVIHRRDRKEQHVKPFHERHRLAVLLDILRKHQAGIRGLPLSILATIAELNATRRLLSESRQNPLSTKLITGIQNPTEYPHTLILLSIADLFVRNGSKLELMAEATGRMCDLRLISPDGEYLNIEVKTPRELCWLDESLSAQGARRQVKTQFHRAGTNAKGQLPPDAPGLLVIGGFSLEPRVHEIFEAAARQYFDRPPGPYSHVVGLIFSWIGTVMTPADAEIVGNKLTFDTMLAVKTENRFVQNPVYEGRLFINMV
jgi:hypothetical protein